MVAGKPARVTAGPQAVMRKPDATADAKAKKAAAAAAASRLFQSVSTIHAAQTGSAVTMQRATDNYIAIGNTWSLAIVKFHETLQKANEQIVEMESKRKEQLELILAVGMPILDLFTDNLFEEHAVLGKVIATGKDQGIDAAKASAATPPLDPKADAVDPTMTNLQAMAKLTNASNKLLELSRGAEALNQRARQLGTDDGAAAASADDLAAIPAVCDASDANVAKVRSAAESLAAVSGKQKSLATRDAVERQVWEIWLGWDKTTSFPPAIAERLKQLGCSPGAGPEEAAARAMVGKVVRVQQHLMPTGTVAEPGGTKIWKARVYTADPAAGYTAIPSGAARRVIASEGQVLIVDDEKAKGDGALVDGAPVKQYADDPYNAPCPGPGYEMKMVEGPTGLQPKWVKRDDTPDEPPYIVNNP